MNGFLQTLESKALKKARTREVFPSRHSRQNIIISKPIKGNILTYKKMTLIWCQKNYQNGSISSIHPVLSDKNQDLDNIASCPEDTSILNAAENSD